MKLLKKCSFELDSYPLQNDTTTSYMKTNINAFSFSLAVRNFDGHIDIALIHSISFRYTWYERKRYTLNYRIMPLCVAEYYVRRFNIYQMVTGFFLFYLPNKGNYHSKETINAKNWLRLSWAYRVGRFFRSTIRSIRRAFLLTPVSASAFLIKVFVQ